MRMQHPRGVSAKKKNTSLRCRRILTSLAPPPPCSFVHPFSGWHKKKQLAFSCASYLSLSLATDLSPDASRSPCWFRPLCGC